MITIDLAALRKAISTAGYTWIPREPPATEFHGLGLLPSAPAQVKSATEVALEVARVRLRVLPAQKSTDAKESILAGLTPPPSAFDWRSRGVIGSVTDQRQCGSCVSFATTGLTSAMAAIEFGGYDLLLSQADQHFCSSHGANCGGWNNADSLGQIKQRGVVTDAEFPYMTAFDSPPQADPADPDVWRAHCRGEAERDFHTYRITDYSAWTANLLPGIADARKYYLANVGPVVCGFTVYQDFDSYGGGVYRHVTGNVRGGHAVMIIGYSDTDRAWICRNSWGASFGGPARPDGTGGGFFKIGYGECGIDNEAFFGCHGVIAPPTLPLVTGVSRGTDKLDIFAAGFDHGVFTAARQLGDTSWRGWWRLQSGVAAPNTAIHAVSRNTDKLDVFCVGTDNHVYTAAWQAGDTTWRGWWKVGDLTVAPGTSVHAVSRSADKLDIFAVGADHGIYTAAWQAGDTAWRGWWRVQGGVAAPNTSVYGVSRSADKLDIFCVGTDHGIYTAAWQPGDTTWRGWWRVQDGTAAPNTSVHAVSRSADKLDIFCVGTNHAVYTAAWEPSFTTWRGWWPVQGGIAAPNTSVYGVSRSADKLDIFCVGTDHGIYTAAWQPGFTTWHGWWRIGAGVAAPGSSVYPVTRSADHLDIFAQLSNHAISTASWQPGNTSWQGWTQIAQGIAEGA